MEGESIQATTRAMPGSQTVANKTTGAGTMAEGEAHAASNNCGLTTNTQAS
jgi:hypothetical protein